MLTSDPTRQTAWGTRDGADDEDAYRMIRVSRKQQEAGATFQPQQPNVSRTKGSCKSSRLGTVPTCQYRRAPHEQQHTTFHHMSSYDGCLQIIDPNSIPERGCSSQHGSSAWFGALANSFSGSATSVKSLDQAGEI